MMLLCKLRMCNHRLLIIKYFIPTQLGLELSSKNPSLHEQLPVLKFLFVGHEEQEDTDAAVQVAHV